MPSTRNGATVSDLQRRAGQLTAETRALGTTLEATLNEVEEVARHWMAERPFLAMAAAGGLGYVLGGGLPSPLTRTLILLASRMAVEMAAVEAGAHLASGSGRKTSGGSD